MTYNPLDILYKEHEIISKSESIINNLNNYWLENPDSYKEKVNKLLSFFQKYADNIHHRKEEEILFAALTDHPDFTLPELIREFENHHEEFRNYISNIQDALAKNQFEASYKLLRSYSLDLRDHIAAENEELFVLAENLLDEDELEKIYFRFKDVDMETGESNIEALIKLLE